MLKSSFFDVGAGVLFVDGKEFTGSRGPENDVIVEGNEVRWIPGDSDYRFKICAVPRGPFEPSPMPTVAVEADSIQIKVSFTMIASYAPTEQSVSALKEIISRAVSVSISKLRLFDVTVTESSRRRLSSLFSWHVSFVITIPLASTPYPTAELFARNVASILESTAFASALLQELGATIDVDSIRVQIIYGGSTTIKKKPLITQGNVIRISVASVFILILFAWKFRTSLKEAWIYLFGTLPPPVYITAAELLVALGADITFLDIKSIPNSDLLANASSLAKPEPPPLEIRSPAERAMREIDETKFQKQVVRRIKVLLKSS
jgi:hypothetical protein